MFSYYIVPFFAFSTAQALIAWISSSDSLYLHMYCVKEADSATPLEFIPIAPAIYTYYVGTYCVCAYSTSYTYVLCTVIHHVLNVV